MTRRLYRSSTNKVVGGVCGGMGDYLGIDPVLIRLLFVFLAVVEGFGALLYVILWIVLPEERRAGEPQDGEAGTESVESWTAKAERLGDDIRSTIDDARASLKWDEGEFEETHRRRTVIAGAALVGIGVLALLRNLGLLWWVDHRVLWPLLITGLGIYLLVRALKEGKA